MQINNTGKSGITYRRKSNSLSGRLNEELVIMDVDKGKYFSLNPVASRIWDLLEKPLSLNDLCNKLMEEYDVDFSTCQKEVRELIEELTKLDLVLVSEIL